MLTAAWDTVWQSLHVMINLSVQKIESRTKEEWICLISILLPNMEERLNEERDKLIIWINVFIVSFNFPLDKTNMGYSIFRTVTGRRSLWNCECDVTASLVGIATFLICHFWTPWLPSEQSESNNPAKAACHLQGEGPGNRQFEMCGCACLLLCTM